MGFLLLDNSGNLITGGASLFEMTAGDPPPSGGWIDDATILAERNRIAALHDIGGTSEASFTGFTDLTGFTTVTAANADAAKTHIGGMGVNDKLRILCQWNGASSLTNGTINGPSQSSLTADGAVDWGFVRPGWSVLLEADTGYTPSFGAASNDSSKSIVASGWNKVEFRGVGFTMPVEMDVNPGFTPCLPMVAFNNCAITGSINMNTGRTLHVEGCTFDTNGYTKAVAQYARIWRNRWTNKSHAGDCVQTFGFSRSYMSSWQASLWYAGNLLDNMEPVETGNHFDCLQYSISADVIAGYDVIFEFNLMMANAPQTEGIFIASGTSVGRTNNMVVHNNIITATSGEGVKLYDESGDGNLFFYRNVMTRAAIGTSTFGGGAFDPTVPVRFQSGSSGTGSYVARENYLTSLDTSLTANSVTNASNTAVNGANIASVFTGNGTWGTNANGWTTYTQPEDGITDAALARTAIRDFFEPLSSGYNAGSGVGPTDPATWPTTFGSALS